MLGPMVSVDLCVKNKNERVEARFFKVIAECVPIVNLVKTLRLSHVFLVG